jgi:hypothetical protein
MLCSWPQTGWQPSKKKAVGGLRRVTTDSSLQSAQDGRSKTCLTLRLGHKDDALASGDLPFLCFDISTATIVPKARRRRP